MTLVDVLTSGQSFEQVEERLKLKPEQWEISDIHKVSPGGNRVPGCNEKFLIKSYSHLGVAGKLTLGFFNDQLYIAWFDPSNSPKYKNALRQKKGIVFGQYEAFETNINGAKFEGRNDYQGKYYVIWSDPVLSGEAVSWAMAND